MTDAGLVVARLAMAALFVMSGYAKLMNVASVAATLGNRGFPQPTALGYAVGVAELVGGLCLVIGFKVRWIALLLLLYAAGTIVISHNFWDMDGPARMSNQIQALKNLAIMSGLLMFALTGAGRYALDRR